MRLKLKILIAAIIVLAGYVPAAHAQASLTFSGGNGTPLSITLQQTVTYTLTSTCRDPSPLFKAVGNPLPSFPNVSGTMSYTIVGGASNSITVAGSNFNFGDLLPNDVFLNYSNSNGDPLLPVGTTFRLNAGTITTNGNIAAAPPANGSYTTYLICFSNDPNFGLKTSNNGTVMTTAAAISINGRVLTNVNRGLMNAIVYLTDSTGNTRTEKTNPFGYYRFEDVSAGQTVMITVVAKRYQFAPQVLTATEDIGNLDFVSLAPLRAK